MDKDIKESGFGLVSGMLTGFIISLTLIIKSDVLLNIKNELMNAEVWSFGTFINVIVSQNEIFFVPYLIFVGIVISIFIISQIVCSKKIKENSIGNILLAYIAGVALFTVIVFGFSLPIILIPPILYLIWLITIPITYFILPFFEFLYNLISLLMSKILMVDINFDPNWTADNVILYYTFLTFVIIVPYLFRAMAIACMLVFEYYFGRPFVDYFLVVLRKLRIETIRLFIYFALFILYTLSLTL